MIPQTEPQNKAIQKLQATANQAINKILKDHAAYVEKVRAEIKQTIKRLEDDSIKEMNAAKESWEKIGNAIARNSYKRNKR